MKTRKLKLDVDALAVDSFDTADAELAKSGTVHAHASLLCTGANGATCGTNPSCDGGYTCDGQYTCNFRSCDAVCGTTRCTDTTSQAYIDGGCL